MVNIKGPLTLKDVSFGPHQIKLTYPGYKDYTQTIRIIEKLVWRAGFKTYPAGSWSSPDWLNSGNDVGYVDNTLITLVLRVLNSIGEGGKRIFLRRL